MNDAEYFQCQFTPGLWRHLWRPITFALVVDDFRIKVKGDEHAQHLYDTLDNFYDVTADWEGKRFVGITLDWQYDKRYVDTHMPGYIPKAQKKFAHPTPKKPQHAPAKAKPIKYGVGEQEADVDTSAPPCRRRKSETYKTSWVLYCTMGAQLILH